jgi:mannose-6-phosphate isomerase-like protein (cupin superfamily)
MAIVQYADKKTATALPSGASETRLVDPQQFLAAKFVDLPTGSTYTVSGQKGVDEYIYVFSGSVSLAGGDKQDELTAGSFAAVHEGMEIKLAGKAGTAGVLIVSAKAPDVDGVPTGANTMAIDHLPVVDIPDQFKQRIYLVGKHAVPSERSHVMVVNYVGDTLTKSHHHPNAESIYFFLKGDALVLANGKEQAVKPGDFVFFGVNDSHGLRSANGGNMSFLEFHAPSAFSTVRE